LLTRIIKRLMKFLTRKGFLIAEQGMTCLADPVPRPPWRPGEQAACTYRIALGPRAGQKVLSVQTVSTREPSPTPVRCVDAQGFSLHAEVCCAAHERKKLEHLCRYITRPAIANERLALNRAGQVVLTLKTPYRDGTTHIVMSPLEFMQRLAALIPRPRLHLIRFHGVLAPNARLRPEIIPSVPLNAHPQPTPAEPPPPAALARLSWARLLTKPPGAVLNGERRPEGPKPGRAFVNGCFNIGTLSPLRRPLEDHRRHRTSSRDRQDPHPSRLARPGTARIARAVIRSIPNGLIPARDPLPLGSTP